MFLVDTDVLSEARKGLRANPGVRAYFDHATRDGSSLFVSAITIGEVRRGVASIRRRGDSDQAQILEDWLNNLLQRFEDRILPFDADCAQLWGELRAVDPGSPLDKQIASTALVHSLTVVTGNVAHFRPTGVPIHDPFTR
jgi:toxin FitB